jgi:hypothetical protein
MPPSLRRRFAMARPTLGGRAEARRAKVVFELRRAQALAWVLCVWACEVSRTAMKLAMVPQQKLRSRARTTLRFRASDGPSDRAPIKYATQAKAWAKFPRPFGPSAPSEARNLRAVRGLDTSVSNETFPGVARVRRSLNRGTSKSLKGWQSRKRRALRARGCLIPRSAFRIPQFI